MPTGTQVFDWTIPREWTIRDAYIKNAAGERVVDFRSCNLHVLNYSRPVRATLPLDELKKHVFTLPDQPDLIPYRTSYYAENWGFCMAHDRLAALPDGLYEVVIDASLEDGSLTYGEYLHRGETDEEFLLSAHVCHPSLANDNCSGLALLTHLAERLAPLRTRYSYRFLFAPGTIGAIAWLARNEHRVSRIRHGLVVAVRRRRRRPDLQEEPPGRCLDRSRHGACPAGTPQRRRRSSTSSPTAMTSGNTARRASISPSGCFSAASSGPFPNITPPPTISISSGPSISAASYRMIAAMIDIVENDWRPRSTSPKGEPQLGRRGLYSALGGDKDGPAKSMAFLWILNLADGRHTLLDIAERAQLPFGVVAEAARLLRSSGLLVEDRAAGRPQALEGLPSADEA